MKAKFVIRPTLNADSDLSRIEADMLVLGKFRNLELSAVHAFNARTDGVASEVFQAKDFIGEENQDFVLILEPGQIQRRVMFAGLGRTQDYGCKVIAHVAQRAVEKAVKHECTRIALPFPAKRSTGSFSLKMQAHYIREAVEAAVSAQPGEGEITIELVCSKLGSAARELKKGVDMHVEGLCCCKNRTRGDCKNQ
ncbi:MAG: M17 family peptidase N-terminal domain-containing protein [Candidatus Obscuribacterales bacterium]|nr:M17 family peptidase N-terminal domain-containing protein [Candidatus Obscuribacterales bacterium]